MLRYDSKLMVILHANPVSTKMLILCMYCSERKIITRSVVVHHFKQPFIPAAINFNHEFVAKNLHMNAINCENIVNYDSQVQKLAKKSCFQYPYRYAVENRIRALFLLSKNLNFTISKLKTFYFSPEIGLRLLVSSANLGIFRTWLSYYTDKDGFGFMSASLYIKITLSNVYFKPLALSSLLLVIFSSSILTIVLTFRKIFRRTPKYAMIRLPHNIIFVAKNPIDQPTSSCDTNGSHLKLNTLILCLWCFCYMHENHAYKAAVFSGSHFQENTVYPINTKEIVESSWDKYCTKGFIDGLNISSVCLLHLSSKDLGNRPNYIKEITKNVFCDLQSETHVVYSMNEWSLSDYRSRKNNSTKSGYLTNYFIN